MSPHYRLYFLSFPISVIFHWMKDIPSFALLGAGSFSIPINVLQLCSWTLLSCLKLLGFARQIWPGAQSRANFAPLLRQQCPGLNSVPHESWDFSSLAGGKSHCSWPGMGICNGSFNPLHGSSLAFPSFRTAMPCYCRICFTESCGLRQETPIRNPDLRVPLFVQVPHLLTRSCELQLLWSLDSQLHLCISQSSGFCLNFSPDTTAWGLAKGSKLGQSQCSPHLFPDTVLCCLMSSVLFQWPLHVCRYSWNSLVLRQ